MPSVLAPELSCGDPLIDGEHARLLVGIEDLLAAARAGDRAAAAEALRALGDALHAHFGHEERMMSEAQYPERGRHKAAHDLFLQDWAEQCAAFAAAGLTAGTLQWISVRMPEWVRFHIQVNDQPLGRYLAHRARQPGAAGTGRSREPAAT